MKDAINERKYLINLVLRCQGKYSDTHLGWLETKFYVLKSIICIALGLWKDDSTYDNVIEGFAFGASHHGFHPDFGDYSTFDYFDIGYGYFRNWYYVVGEDSSI